MSLKNFLRETEKGLPATAYFLYAGSQYLLDEAIAAVKRTIPEAEVDFNFNIFDMESADGVPTFDEITGILNTLPFFGKKRHVIVKNFQRFPQKEFKKIQSYIANPSPASVFLMLHSGTIKKELKENIKGIKTFPLDMREQDLHFWIKEKLRQRGLAIKDRAVEYLIGTVGPETGLLSSEMEKLALLGSSTIDIINIKEIVEWDRDYGVFELTEALKEKNAEKAFKIYRALSGTLEPQSFLGAINWQYSKMSKYAKDRDSRTDYYRRIFELLNDADIQIKTAGGSYPMEYLLIRLLQL